MDSDRKWPDHLGDVPPAALGPDIVGDHIRRAIDEGLAPASVADLVADAIEVGRFWVFPHPNGSTWPSCAGEPWPKVRTRPVLATSRACRPPTDHRRGDRIVEGLTPD